MLYDVNTITTIVLLDSGLNTDQYIKTHYTYAQIPVGLTYHLFSRSKFSIGIGATFIYMRLLNASFYEYDFKSNRYIKREKNNQGHLRKNNIAVSGNVAFNYKTGKRFGFCISPSWQYFINSIFDEQYKLNQQHNNFGIKAAVNYFFK